MKQYYEEPGTGTIRQILRDTERIGTASLSYVEVFSALNRKLREKAIDREQYRAAAEAFDGDWTHLVVVPISEEVFRRARTLLEHHDLRAGDAIQLASALILGVSAPVEFASADRRLNQAARAEGRSTLL